VRDRCVQDARYIHTQRAQLSARGGWIRQGSGLFLHDICDARHGVPLVLSPQDPMFPSPLETPAASPVRRLAAVHCFIRDGPV
jgi:hypothetical protein